MIPTTILTPKLIKAANVLRRKGNTINQRSKIISRTLLPRLTFCRFDRCIQAFFRVNVSSVYSLMHSNKNSDRISAHLLFSQ